LGACAKITYFTSIQQGLELLDAMNEVFSQKQWRIEPFHEECKMWLQLLLELVDYNHSPEVLLHEFISSQRRYVVAKHLQGFITDQVVTGVRKRLKKFSVHQFFVLYRDFKIWPAQVLL